MSSDNIKYNEMPTILKFFTIIFLLGFIGSFIWGIIEFIDFSYIGIIYLIQSLFFLIIFIGLINAKKWSLYLLPIFFITNLVYSLIINYEQVMKESGLISLGIMLIVLLIILYLLSRDEVKNYFSIV